MANLLSWLGGGIKKVAHKIDEEVVDPVQRFVAPRAKAAVAQLNPADGGRTYNTVMQKGVDFTPHPNQSAINQITHSGIPNAVGSFANNITGIPTAIDTARWATAKLTHNKPAEENASLSLTKNITRFAPIGMAESFKNGFGQDIATAVTSPYANYLAEREKKRAEKELIPAYEQLYRVHGLDPRIGREQAESEAFGAKNQVLNQHLSTAGIDQDTPTNVVRRKVIAHAAETAANIAFADQMASGLLKAPNPIPLLPGAESGLVKNTLSTGGVNAAASIAGTAGSDNPSFLDYVKSGGLGFATGAAFPIVEAAAPQAIRYTTKTIANSTPDSVAHRALLTSNGEYASLQSALEQSTKAANKLNQSGGSKTAINQHTRNIKHIQDQMAEMRRSMSQGGYAKLPGGKNNPAPDLTPEQAALINDYAEMLENMGSGNGVSITPDGRRVTNNYRATDIKGKAMSKADWFDQARQEIESGKGAFGASEEYAKLPPKKLSDKEILNGFNEVRNKFKNDQEFYNNFILPEANKNSRSADLAIEIIGQVENGNMPLKSAIDSSIYPDVPGSTRYQDARAELVRIAAKNNQPQLLKELDTLTRGMNEADKTKLLNDALRNYRDRGGMFAERNKDSNNQPTTPKTETSTEDTAPSKVQPEIESNANIASSSVPIIPESPKINRRALTGKQLEVPNKALYNPAEYEKMFGPRLSRREESLPRPKNLGPDSVGNILSKRGMSESEWENLAPGSHKVLNRQATPRERPLYTPENMGRAQNGEIAPAKGGIPPKDIQAHGQETKELKKEFRKHTTSYLGSKEAAKTRNVTIVRKLPKLNEQQSLAVIDAIENGDQSPEFGNLPKEVRAILNAKHAELRDNNVKIGYLEDYFPHKWQNEAKVRQEYQALNLRAGIQNPRELPTIAEGIKMGFKPTTTDYRKALLTYLNTADNLLANRKYFDSLQNRGYIIEAGTRPHGMQVIDAPGVPEPRPYVDPESGNTFQGSYYAKPDIARDLNKLFGAQDEYKALKIGAKISGTAQDVFLSGGVPNTPLNAFGVAQFTKEALSGHPVVASKRFLQSFSQKAINSFFDKKIDVITKMESQGIGWGGGIDERSLTSIGDKIADASGIGKAKVAIKEGWSSLVNDPNFRRLIPAYMVDNFEIAYKRALKNNLSEAEAVKQAGEVVKKNFGISDMASQRLRSKNFNNTISTFFFAPKYRESMVNFWIDNAKALGHPGSPAYRDNAKFLAAATVLFGLMQAANYQTTGHTTFGNSNPGDKLSWNIPTGGSNSISIPFLSSIATIPRTAFNIGASALTGDFKEAGMQSKNFLSMGTRPFFDLATNQKWNGRQIIGENDSTATKFKKAGGYLAGQFSHPYVNAAIQKATDDDKSISGLETASTVLELPIRFRTGRPMTFDGVDTKLNDKQSNDYDARLKQANKTYLHQLTDSDIYKNLSKDDQVKALRSLKSDITESVKRQFTADYGLGQYANDYDGKQTIPSKKQRDLLTGKFDAKNYVPKGGKGGSNVSINSGISKNYARTLDDYNNLSTQDREKLFNTQNDAEYNYKLAKYNNDKANGTLSRAEDIRTKSILNKAKVGSKYSKDIRDLYGLNKNQVYSLVTSDPNGKKIAEQLISYDQALYNAGIISKPKYKNGAITQTGSGGRGSSGKAQLSKLASIIGKASAIKPPEKPKSPGIKVKVAGSTGSYKQAPLRQYAVKKVAISKTKA